jgi:hypothetical protein
MMIIFISLLAYYRCNAGNIMTYTHSLIVSSVFAEQKLFTDDLTAYDSFGYSISMDDNHIAVGAYESDQAGNSAVCNRSYVYQMI